METKRKRGGSKKESQNGTKTEITNERNKEQMTNKKERTKK